MLRFGREILSATARGFAANRLTSMAAGIAFYTIFSLAPILIVAIALAEPLLGRLAAQESILSQLRDAFGADTVEMLRRALERNLVSGDVWWTKAFGFAALLYAGTAIFVELESALAVIWRDPDASVFGSLRAELRSRLLALLAVAILGLVLLAAILAGIALSAYGGVLKRFPLVGAWLGPALSQAWILTISATFFTLLYKFLSGAHRSWFYSLIPGIAVSLLLAVGNSALAWYFEYTEVGSAFGAAGALAGVMLWIYYSAVIVLLAAQISRATYDTLRKFREHPS